MIKVGMYLPDTKLPGWSPRVRPATSATVVNPVRRGLKL
jgi:hypothetical protein